MTMQIGEVRTCVHCEGTGMCKQGFAKTRSCKLCLTRAGLDADAMEVGVCSICEGKGAVWIGPNLVELPRQS